MHFSMAQGWSPVQIIVEAAVQLVSSVLFILFFILAAYKGKPSKNLWPSFFGVRTSK